MGLALTLLYSPLGAPRRSGIRCGNSVWDFFFAGRGRGGAKRDGAQLTQQCLLALRVWGSGFRPNFKRPRFDTSQTVLRRLTDTSLTPPKPFCVTVWEVSGTVLTPPQTVFHGTVPHRFSLAGSCQRGGEASSQTCRQRAMGGQSKLHLSSAFAVSPDISIDCLQPTVIFNFCMHSSTALSAAFPSISSTDSR